MKSRLFVDAKIMHDIYYEILGAKFSYNENSVIYDFFFDYMKERGLNRRQVNNFLHAKKDTESSLRFFLGLIWQTCYLHLIRKVIRKVP